MGWKVASESLWTTVSFCVQTYLRATHGVFVSEPCPANACISVIDGQVQVLDSLREPDLQQCHHVHPAAPVKYAPNSGDDATIASTDDHYFDGARFVYRELSRDKS